MGRTEALRATVRHCWAGLRSLTWCSPDQLRRPPDEVGAVGYRGLTARAWCRSSKLSREPGGLWSGHGSRRPRAHNSACPQSPAACHGPCMAGTGQGPRQPPGSPPTSRARAVRSRFAAPPLGLLEAATDMQRVVRALLGSGAALAILLACPFSLQRQRSRSGRLPGGEAVHAKHVGL